ncbi:MAG: hypothetical protein NVSMB66_1630 [Candidatus Doudnabacteria bacterium]
MSHHHEENDKGTAIGLGILGFALGAVVGMFMAPKSGKETRENLTNWTSNMSDDLNKKLKDTKDMSEDKYKATIDEVAYKYRKMRGIERTELEDFVDDLKMRWARIKDQWQNNDDWKNKP